MKLRNIGSNQTVLSLDNGTEILFSYDTPVAGFVEGYGYVKTDKFHSKTTTKHINSYLGPSIYGVMIKPQSFFDGLTK